LNAEISIEILNAILALLLITKTISDGEKEGKEIFEKRVIIKV
jgi:hypothetical protein